MTDDANSAVQNGRSVERRSNEKYAPAKIMEALQASRGMIATAARLLSCSRQTIYDAIARHPEIDALVAGERELLLDTAELRLQEAVEAGESWAVRFLLVTQGKGRGYIQRYQPDEESEKITVIINRQPVLDVRALPAKLEGPSEP